MICSAAPGFFGCATRYWVVVVRAVALSTGIMLSSAAVLNAQQADDEIILGAVSLRLGMSQDDVLRQLRSSFALRETDGTSGDGWFVYSQGQPQRAVGNIGFEDGRLVFVFKHWFPQGTSAVDSVASALYAAVELMAGGDWRACQVTNYHLPGTTLNQTIIDCGLRRISVSFGSGHPTQVEETLTSIR